MDAFRLTQTDLQMFLNDLKAGAEIETELDAIKDAISLKAAAAEVDIQVTQSGVASLGGLTGNSEIILTHDADDGRFLTEILDEVIGVEASDA